MHHRPSPIVRSTSSSLAPSLVSSRVPTPRHSPLLPAATYPTDKYVSPLDTTPQQPSICGLPLKYVSLVTLAVQNAALSIVMHYSRVSIPTSQAYSPASAVLLNELLKGSISFFIALLNSPILSPQHAQHHHYMHPSSHPLTRHRRSTTPNIVIRVWWAFTELCNQVFSPDCWKLSIPAILYVIQNSLQFVAISNLPVATFQVTYQMKILTTAAFSVALLRKKLSVAKWLSLFFLAIGVGIVQIQTTVGSSSATSFKHGPSSDAVGSAHDFNVHVMNPMKGFGAVIAACFTSGLAGVYFEMVLKGSKADLWVRNVQLSLFSLIPALLPVIYANNNSTDPSAGIFGNLLRNFGGWAWATVLIQVFGGLVTAIVIKYSDNILKGFATSLSIVLSFLASVALFDFSITPSFIIGAGTVLTATWMYNKPAPPAYTAPVSVMHSSAPSPIAKAKEEFAITLNEASPTQSGKSSPTPSSLADSGVLGLGNFMRRKSSGFNGLSRTSSAASLTALLGASSDAKGALGLAESGELPPSVSPSVLSPSASSASVSALGGEGFQQVYPPEYTPYGSRVGSRLPSRAPSPGLTLRRSES
ncbi:nucleotide-sugar transporter-domain-containing protein [Panaeolus papilionaceus]|nr:nucleotide-sugar transporter-domain-containing protein [Panaeolus papilionaceus]